MTRTYYSVEWTDEDGYDHELAYSSLVKAREVIHQYLSGCSWAIYRHKVKPIEDSEGISQ